VKELKQKIDKFGFRTRIRLGMALVIIIVMAFSTTVSIFFQNRGLINSLNRLGRYVALNLSYNSKLGVLSEEPANLEQPLNAVLGEQQVVGAVVFLLDGKPLSSKQRREYTLGITIAEQEKLVRASREPVFIVSTKTSSGQPLRSYFAKVIIEKSGVDIFGVEAEQKEVQGFVRVDLSLDELVAQKAVILYQNVLLIPVFIFVGLIFSVFVEKRISKPLTQLKIAASKISKGDFSTRIDTKSEDELGLLAHTFNDMSRQLSMTIDQLNYANERLEKANAELQDFTYIVSHDLQEPLRKVYSFGQFLIEDFSDNLPEEGKDYVQRMQKATARMKVLIRDLLKLSRVGTADEAVTAVNSKEAVSRALDDLSVAIEESGAEVNVGKLPPVMANSTQLVQLFENLIGNAIKYRSNDKKLKIDVSAEADADKVRFSIRDNGIGIEKKFLEKIFGVFQRLHNDENYQGTGIGLALCKKIIQRHNGRIWVESEFGVGTTFYFTMPKAKIDGGNRI
jgi:signal transduction histidine kinase